MKQIFDNILHSLDNIPSTGYSAKKLTAFAIALCVISAHVKWIALGNFTQLEMVLTIDYSFIAVLFGINEYGKLKSQPKDEAKPD